VPYTPDDRTVVLYAPTWEGDRDAAAYGSIATHGVALAEALLADDRYRLIYRPHPRSGVVDKEYGAANRAIIEAIERANSADPGAHHVFDDGPQLGWQLAAADIAITDISAMVYDRLATGKPLIVTRPASDLADVDDTGYLGHCEWLRADAAPAVIDLIETVQHSAEAQRSLRYWVERHFGDTTPGVATERFHGAVRELVELWDREAAVHEHDSFGNGVEPGDDEDEDSAPDE
jgi:CDP-glycerol glycerophosphotransferase (TagB/SpsB family)